jgi:imidazolonepropionase
MPAAGMVNCRNDWPERLTRRSRRAAGGILQTVTATRAATDQELFEAARGRLDAMLACGTTTCEIKSGYGTDHGIRAPPAARHQAVE